MAYFIKALVSGRVQGVCFRDATKKKAIELGVNGWVKNTPQGSVNVVAEGTEEQLSLFIDWLYIGPNYAKVEDVEVEWLKSKELHEFFSVRY